MNVDKKRMIMKAFIGSQFGYFPLVWMFHSQNLNNKINRIHERALRIIYNDKSSSFQNLLEKDNSVTIHHTNIKILATETQILTRAFPYSCELNFCGRKQQLQFTGE